MAIKTKRFIRSSKNCSCSMPGVWRAVAYCDGVVVIFHSPRACAHVARTMDINSFYRSMSDGMREDIPPVPLLSSQLEEKHAIFGGGERLQQCLAFAVKTYQPQCLVLANSCVAGVIGDDVAAVAREAEAAYGIPVLTVDCCGFLDGEYYQGYFEITEQLAARFMQPCAQKQGTALLLGDNGGPWGSYAREVTRYLKALGMQVIGQFPGYVPFKRLPEMAAAEALVVLGGRGQTHIGLSKLAAKLAARLGMKYLPNSYPVGWQQTQRWLLAMGKLLRREAQAALLLEQEQKKLHTELEKLLPVTRRKKVVLCVGRWLMYFHPAAVLETIKLLQLDLLGIVLLDAYSEKQRIEMLAALQACTAVPVYNTSEGEHLFQEAALVLTTHELQNKEVKQIFLPMLPLVGATGELEFMQAVYRCLCSRLKGGLTYV